MDEIPHIINEFKLAARNAIEAGNFTYYYIMHKCLRIGTIVRMPRTSSYLRMDL